MTALHEAVRVRYIECELPAVLSSVAEARIRLVAFAIRREAPAIVQGAVALASSEAVTNVVRHAYDDDRPGRVWIDADFEDACIEVVVSDSGRGLAAEPAGGQGLGLMLMRELCDAFEIRDRPCDGVEVWMMFATARGEQDGRSASGTRWPPERPGHMRVCR